MHVFQLFGLFLDDYAAALPAIVAKETALPPISPREGPQLVGHRKWTKKVLSILWGHPLLPLLSPPV